MIVNVRVAKNVSIFMFCKCVEIILWLWLCGLNEILGAICGGLTILKLHKLPVSVVNNDVSSSTSYVYFCCIVEILHVL